MSTPPPLLDRRGRPLRDLRISVMDRCNFRCTYCMPASTYGDDYAFLDNAQRLDFNEIERVCRQAARLGVSKLRLTGGEPLLRPGLPELVARLKSIAGIDDIALTTNGVLLDRQATALAAAGLDRITVSLDTLDALLFRELSGGRGDVHKVLQGIEVARHAGFRDGVKINAVLQRDVNDAGAMDLVGYFRGTGVVLRFIEFMDVGNRNAWSPQSVVSSEEVHARIQARWALQALPPRHTGEVATRYRFVDGAGEIGLISSISKPFCGDCTRARLSSEGQLYTCLFAGKGTDLRRLLRASDDDAALHAVLAGVWSARNDRYSELRGNPVAASGRRIEMHYIGG